MTTGTHRDKRAVCHDCGTLEGQLHKLGCDMESCPFCGGQLITCGCEYTKLGFDYDWNKEPTCGLPQDIYENGLPDNLWEQRVKILERKGRIPYIQYPNMCCYCGELWPDMFSVPNFEWKLYVEPRERGKMLCRKCYDHIKELINRNDKEGENDIT